MNKLINMKMIYPLIAIIVVIAFFLLYKRQSGQAKVSEFGRYQGYSEAIYDGTKRISDYLTMSNGTRLAYDLILPTKKGVPASEALPVLFKYTPYLRTWTIFDKNGKNIISDFVELGWKEKAMLRIRYWFSERGRLFDPLFRTKWLERLIMHGYAVIIVERPGTGASFGVMNPTFEASARECNEILDWIASQRWCNGKIGMHGDSFQAMVQFAAASTGNPHLKAIFPASCPIEMYDGIMYPGGVYNKAFSSFFSGAASFLEALTTPVDSDKDGTLLAQARRERKSATMGERLDLSKQPQLGFRDALIPDGKNLWEDRMALYPFIERINRSGIAVYMTTGWYDIFTDGMFFWHKNLTVPRRLAVRPLDHTGMDKTQSDLDYAAEAHRWFDHWLKGINNGIMDEPPIHYYVMATPRKEAWQISSRWPLENQKLTRFYFGQGETGSTGSVNDGSLTKESPTAPDAFDEYTVDYTATTGKKSRWTAVNFPRDYPDMRSNDKKALTYTTSSLETDVEVTGHPVVHLWLRTDAPDLDAFVYLEEVNRSGKSTYITERNLRASHRKLSKAPFDNLGLPFHSHYRSHLEPIPAGKPVELVFSLLPTSYRFHKGNSIRITVAFADADNFDTPILNPAPKLHLLRDLNHPSLIQLPIVQSR
jgi:putative CocE/NonD family hydrolase